MQYVPHPYQRYAIDFIESHPVAALILDMGLGKTSVTLTAIADLMFDRFEISRVLVIAPLRVARMTWPDELLQWDHLHHLTYAVAVGTEQERRAAVLQDADITIINRENLPWLVEKSRLPLHYDMLVIDELSSFKNWQAQRFKAFMKLRPTARRAVGLTGTPSSNGIMDLFAEYRCLDMGQRLGRFIGRYRAAYFTPEKSDGNVVYSYKLRPGAEEQIYERISDITISMKAMDHLKMPDLIKTRYPVKLSDEEREAYNRLKADMVLRRSNVRDTEPCGVLPAADQISVPAGSPDRSLPRSSTGFQNSDATALVTESQTHTWERDSSSCMKPDSTVTATNAAALANKLSQLANGCVYGDDGKPLVFHDRKLDALEDILEAATSPVLVCYWFQHDLQRISGRLSRLGISYEQIRNDASIRRWNDGKIPVGLIHPASAGHGLNLQQGGHTMVWFGLTWSLELYEQTVARLWRQGQQAQTVIVTHIVTERTIDEQILRALDAKSATQEALIEAVKAEISSEREEP